MLHVITSSETIPERVCVSGFRKRVWKMMSGSCKYSAGREKQFSGADNRKCSFSPRRLKPVWAEVAGCRS